MERELVSFRSKLEWQNVLKKINRCMQLRKICMSEVMIDKAMESGLQYMDDEGALKEKYG